MKKMTPRPITLVILDGWGERKETSYNAIAAAHKPNWDKLCAQYPHTLISGSGRCVGLPDNQMGNSEVGHLNMGAGRIVYQDLTRIDSAIRTGEFFSNKILCEALEKANQSGKAVHVMGLLSPGGVHSHEKHIQALITLAAQHKVKSLYIHAFLDGRDVLPRSAAASLESLQAHCNEKHCGQIVSLIGRYYAMDRDKRWDRVQKAYDLIVSAQAAFTAPDVLQGLKLAYERGETDEFIQPTRINPVTVNDGDAVIFMNFRADRARELTQAFIQPEFTEFHREKWPKLGEFICLSEYDSLFKVSVAYPPLKMNNILGEYLSQLGLTQLRIAETEKYAHVTFFFNGGIEQPYPGETRILVPSPKTATYDLQPQMSAPELTERLMYEIQSQAYDLIICNFANADMVGHTGNFDATVKAIEILDECLGKIFHAVQQAQGELLITADHGNAEKMFDNENNQPHTAHTNDPVPFIYAGRKAIINKENGKLSDIAPTILYLLGLPQPHEMTGSSLIKYVTQAK